MRPVQVERDGEVTHGGKGMAEGDKYLAMALELLRRAENKLDPAKRAGLETLAEQYRAQAEQARRDSALTIKFKFPEQEAKE
jgi:hypothetical protein